MNEFFDRYREKYGEPETSFPINGYSVIQMIKVAAERAGSLDSDAVLAEMNKFDKEPLLWGETTYTADTHIDLTHVLTIVQIQGGKGSYAGKAVPRTRRRYSLFSRTSPRICTRTSPHRAEAGSPQGGPAAASVADSSSEGPS